MHQPIFIAIFSWCIDNFVIDCIFIYETCIFVVQLQWKWMLFQAHHMFFGVYLCTPDTVLAYSALGCPLSTSRLEGEGEVSYNSTSFLLSPATEARAAGLLESSGIVRISKVSDNELEKFASPTVIDFISVFTKSVFCRVLVTLITCVLILGNKHNCWILPYQWRGTSYIHFLRKISFMNEMVFLFAVSFLIL